jgi:hypothetical protein
MVAEAHRFLIEMEHALAEMKQHSAAAHERLAQRTVDELSLAEVEKDGPMQGLSAGLRCPPVIRDLLIVVVPDARHVNRVAFLPCPLNRFVLGLEGLEHVIGMVLDHIIVNRITFWPVLRPRLNKHIRHCRFL